MLSYPVIEKYSEGMYRNYCEPVAIMSYQIMLMVLEESGNVAVDSHLTYNGS